MKLDNCSSILNTHFLYWTSGSVPLDAVQKVHLVIKMGIFASSSFAQVLPPETLSVSSPQHRRVCFTNIIYLGMEQTRTMCWKTKQKTVELPVILGAMMLMRRHCKGVLHGYMSGTRCVIKPYRSWLMKQYICSGDPADTYIHHQASMS